MFSFVFLTIDNAYWSGPYFESITTLKVRVRINQVVFVELRDYINMIIKSFCIILHR